MKMRYYMPDQGETVEEAISLPGELWEHNSYTAEKAAEDEWHNHHGWEARWPQIIALVSEDMQETRWEVALEMMDPCFDALETKEEKET